MLKSNWIVYAVAIVVSAFLLWLWYHLSFNMVDAPLDLVLSIIWWVLVAVAVLVIRNREKVRRERVNTCYLAPMKLYNSELGLQDLEAGESPVARIQKVLEELEYNFHMEPFPGEDDENGNSTDKVNFVYVVRTKKFKVEDDEAEEQSSEAGEAAVAAASQDQQQKQVSWEGEVAVVARPKDDPLPFNSRDELLAILEGNTVAAAAA